VGKKSPKTAGEQTNRAATRMEMNLGAKCENKLSGQVVGSEAAEHGDRLAVEVSAGRKITETAAGKRVQERDWSRRELRKERSQVGWGRTKNCKSKGLPRGVE